MAARNLTPKLSRRDVIGLGVLGATGIAVGLAGCSAADTAAPTSASKTGVEIGKASSVPVGGGLNFTVDDVPIVVTQVSEGDFKAFSAVCTHQGCLVGCRDKEIICDCHASIFDPNNGKVLSGPAPTPLPEIPIEVRDGVIYTV
jgi:Rieske Fe-S protein